MNFRLNVTRFDRHYTGALFVPRVVECGGGEGFRAGLSEEQAQALDAANLRSFGERHPGATRIVEGNILGTWFADDKTTHSECGWGNADMYLQDTPVPVSAGLWQYMLEVLPPRHWGRSDGAETFQMSERQCDDITGTLIRIGHARWYMYAPMGEPRPQLVQRLIAGLSPLVGVDGKPRRLRCSCCGAETRGRQWWNQDDGYGLCPACIPMVARGDMEALAFTHGLQGVHFATVA